MGEHQTAGAGALPAQDQGDERPDDAGIPRHNQVPQRVRRHQQTAVMSDCGIPHADPEQLDSRGINFHRGQCELRHTAK